MSFNVAVSDQACGAEISGIDLTRELLESQISDIRDLWLEHHVLSFPNQLLDDDALERFTLCFGSFGDDPFIAPIPGRKNIIAVKRGADEKVPIFADNWHTDWSFQEKPPAGTCLYGKIIPTKGGDTLFANQHMALEKMPSSLRKKLEGKNAIHSALIPYSPGGGYGDKDREMGRSMDIRASDEAFSKQLHPIIKKHPETKREGIYGTIGYIIGIDGMDNQDAMKLLMELSAWQCLEEFVYKHKWKKDMLIMWDNRSVLHRATGGYEGQERLLHRTTVAAYGIR
jgi:taurine dioxygenase